ncbi:hypothetical protein ACR78Z_13205 [Sphingobacterium thalpophilum]|uniref:DUF4412 domain-containing protein n=1 Tax=Sphingobacterium thalpophilum TaxID=259 RepID=A0A4U9UNN2_9SPHI|nr:hypothetical protein [Sphingobacterium thalpophilum]VTR35310.1 Uncharacterised protein [Sphingobacterium thalpophilum]
MKLLSTILVLLTLCCNGSLFAQSDFEGTLTTRVTMAGVDLSRVTEKIDYEKGDIQEQLATLYKTIPAQDLARMQILMEQNPMMGLAMVMTPPKATIHVKGKVAFVKTRGLGYEIQHYHNEQSDEAFLYTVSLIQPGEAVTAAYKPSQGYDALFTDDKRITADNFNVERSPKTADVAGYTCAMSTYTPKSLQSGTDSPMGIPSVQVHKLVVYTSKDLPKGINFSHPYYLPEDNGIMRIDIYLTNGAEPTMVYEMVEVKKAPISDTMLVPKKTEPLYALTDMNYGMKLLGIMMGGMAAMDMGDDEGDDGDDEENE